MSGDRLTIFDTTLRDGEQAPGFSLRIDEKLKIAYQLRSLGENQSIADRLLEFLRVSYTASHTDLGRIPKDGPAIVAVTHPFGIIGAFFVLRSGSSFVKPQFKFF